MSSMGTGQAIFKKVAISERKLIFREIADDKTDFVFKTADNDDIFHMTAAQIEKNETILCRHTADSREVAGPVKVLANFVFKNERYFFQTELAFKGEWGVIRTDGELFILQRRANARIEIPAEYDCSFNIINHQGKVHFFETRILDISAGGLKICFEQTQPLLKEGDVVRGALHLGKRRTIELDVQVRFAQKKEIDGVMTQTAGLMFVGVEHLLEYRLLSLMMDLQREFFIKYPKKN